MKLWGNIFANFPDTFADLATLLTETETPARQSAGQKKLLVPRRHFMKKIITSVAFITLTFTLATLAWGQKTERQRKPGRSGQIAAQNPSQARQQLAVLSFQNKAGNQWWYHGGAEAAQDVFVTELVKSNKFSGVVEREQLAALLKQKNLTLSGDVDPKTAIQAGKMLGVNYLLTGSVTEYGNTDVGGGNARKRKLGLKVTTQLIDTSTGEIVWADEARAETPPRQISVGGFGGGVDDERIYNQLMKQCAQQVGQKISLSKPKN
jgi:curli biogenesis system outer membrane secretion channel CsgG